MKLWMPILICLGIQACSSSSKEMIPVAKGIVIDGMLEEEDWKNAFKHGTKKDAPNMLFLQDDNWVYIAILVNKHKDLPDEKEIIKERLSFTEIHLKTKEKIWTLHASSMNGQREFLAKKDFDWNEFDNWKANSEGVTKSGKFIPCQAYEYRISKNILADNQLEMIGSILPFYNGSFDPIFFPSQSKETLNNWLKISF